MSAVDPAADQPSLRWSSVDDAVALARVHVAACDDPWSADACRTLLQMLGAFGIVVEEAGGIVGFILCRVAVDEAEVLTLAVLPTARRRGLGRALLQEAMGVARAQGASRLYLEVAEANVAARQLYAGRGLQVGGRRPGYYRVAGRPAEDALVMVMTL